MYWLLFLLLVFFLSDENAFACQIFLMEIYITFLYVNVHLFALVALQMA